ncbi:MAG TPA: hypothetical protein VGX26_01060 [Solirubrobacteraceae bacterium]|jgi:hypothetical protein|nr:hypothetical protein [Solirubrobacteraceae bacterium]
MSTTTTIKWDTEAKMLGADPTATLALDRSAWERIGAIFTELDDGDGETPGLATATVQVAGVPVEFGVLDYNGATTYLLVPGTDPERHTTIALLETLQAAGALGIDTDLLDLANGKPPPTLEDRVADLERRLAETQSELTARARWPTKGSGKWLMRKSAKTSRSSMQGT